MAYAVAAGLKRTACMVVLRHARSLLLLERANAPNAGMFVPVGGKVDPFERPRTAAARELYEETGIDVRSTVAVEQAAPVRGGGAGRAEAQPLLLRYAGTLVETSPTKYNWTSHIYVCDLDTRIAPPPSDEGTLHWVGVDEVLDPRHTDTRVNAAVVGGGNGAANTTLGTPVDATEQDPGFKTPPTDAILYRYVLEDRPFMLDAEYVFADVVADTADNGGDRVLSGDGGDHRVLRLRHMREELEGVVVFASAAQPQLRSE